VKPTLLLIGAAGAVLLTSCTTLENRRDMFFPQRVNGPYTRMVRDGIPETQPVHGVFIQTQTSDYKGAVVK